MANNLIKGNGNGTLEWREDFVLTSTDQNTSLFSVKQATGATQTAGILSLSGIEAGLTAHAGGTQAAALALSTTKPLHQLATVGTAADSVALPLATGGGALHVISNGAAKNSAQVYGSGTDTINGVASATGAALDTGKSAVFVDYAAGKWFMILSA